MLSHRTLVLFNETKHKRDLVSVLDRHLFDKEDSYFFKSSKEMLELWGSKIKTAIKFRVVEIYFQNHEQQRYL